VGCRSREIPAGKGRSGHAGRRHANISWRSGSTSDRTSGTLRASIDLIRKVGGTAAAAACLNELTFLNGRAGLDIPVETLIRYEE
jgi:hypothetical protein